MLFTVCHPAETAPSCQSGSEYGQTAAEPMTRRFSIFESCSRRAEADPVRRRVLEALARRAATQTGALRQRLVDRLVQRATAAPVPLPARPAAPAPRSATQNS